MKKIGTKKINFKLNKKTIAIIAGIVALLAIAGIATFASTGDPKQQYVELITIQDPHKVDYSGPTTQIKAVESEGFYCSYSVTTSVSTKNSKGVWSSPSVKSTTLDYVKISKNDVSLCPKSSSKTTYSTDKKTKTTVTKALEKGSSSTGVTELWKPITKTIAKKDHERIDDTHGERIKDNGVTYSIEAMSEGDNLNLTVSAKDCKSWVKVPVGSGAGQMIPGNKYKITMTYKIPGAERVKVYYPVSRAIEYTVPVRFTKKTYQTGGYFDSRNGQPQAVRNEYSLPALNTVDNSKDYKVYFSAAYKLPEGSEHPSCKVKSN